MTHVRFYANMRTVTGLAELEVSQSRARTLRELLVGLSELFPALLQYLMDEHGNLYQDIPIFVNGRNPRLTGKGINMALEPDDVISVFSPIASGRMNVEALRVSAIDEQEQLR